MNETELVRGLCERHEDAVREYLQRYRRIFLHCIAQFESEPARREDLFQDLTWHAIDRVRKGRFDPQRGSFGSWLYQVARCRCVDLERRRNGRRQVRLTLPAGGLSDQPDDAPGPGETACGEELDELVHAAFAALDADERELLEQRYVEGRTLAQVSAQLGITLEQAKYRLRRAAASMRRLLRARTGRWELAGC